MNPFQKLRRAVEKVNIQYEMPEDIENKGTRTKLNLNRQIDVGNNQNLTRNKSPTQRQRYINNNGNVTNNNNIQRIVLQQQTKYIQEINELTSKNQRLTKSFKLIQIQKQELIQQICVLEKNNQILEEKIKDLYKNYGHSDDKQRKYKQEIHRINKTIQMLGIELNTQKNAKKSAMAQLTKIKQQFQGQNTRYSKRQLQLQQKIQRLQGQIKQRSEMLEYYIKKNSQQRRENKMHEEKIKIQNENKIQELNENIIRLKDQLSNYRANYDILNHKYQSITSTYQNVQHKYQGLEIQLNEVQQNNRRLQNSLRDAQQRIKQLSMEIQNLTETLRLQKENVKLKVVQIKDQTLELQLQMYKRQCKQLLQQKAISQKLGTNRLFQPSYQIFQNK